MRRAEQLARRFHALWGASLAGSGLPEAILSWEQVPETEKSRLVGIMEQLTSDADELRRMLASSGTPHTEETAYNNRHPQAAFAIEVSNTGEEYGKKLLGTDNAGSTWLFREDGSLIGTGAWV